MSKKRASSSTPFLVRLDPSASQPLHRQLYEEIRNAILGGLLHPGHPIPASRGLADDLDISRTTVLQAIDQLKAEGYLKSVVGSGTRVADVLPERLTQINGQPRAVSPAATPATLARRGMAITGIQGTELRAGSEPRAFRLGIPGLDLFPRKLWNRLLIQRARLTSVPELDYGDPAGVDPLRRAIASYVASARGVHCTPDQVIVVGGAQQGIASVCRLLLDPGDDAWLEEPGYTSARSALIAASARIVPVPVDAQGIDVAEGIRRAPGARLVYVTPSHQYPLGSTMSLQRRIELLEWAHAANAWVVEDDYDSEFRYGGRPLMALHGLGGSSRVIYLGTFSKSVFPALRIGYLVVPHELAGAFARARMYSDLHPPTLQQLVLADFIQRGHFARHVRRMRKTYELRQNRLVREVREEIPGSLKLRPRNAGLHMVGYLPPDIHDQDVVREALSRGVEVSALSLHYAGSTARNGLLMGFASVDEEGIRRGVLRLRDAIQAARARPSGERVA